MRGTKVKKFKSEGNPHPGRKNGGGPKSLGNTPWPSLTDNKKMPLHLRGPNHRKVNDGSISMD